MQSDEAPGVAVVGAGMVGVCCALELQRRGLKVQLFDRKPPGQETSFGNAGVIARSSLIPFNNPGLWPGLPRFLTNRTAQLRYNPLYLLQEMKWGFGFLSRARPSVFKETTLALDALIRASIPAHRLLMQAAGCAHRLREDGWIYLYRDAQALAKNRLAREVFDHFEIATQELDPSALRSLEPHLHPIFQRALWIKDACSVDDPGQVVQAYARLFQARGGVLLQREMAAMHRDARGVWQLRGSDGSVTPAGKVVIALGPWANDLLAPLKLAAPLAFERGYHQNFVASPAARLTRPVYDMAAGYVLAPMENGTRLSTGVELTRRDAPVNMAQLKMTEVAARQAFPLGAQSGTPWLGSRPTLPDSRPLIGAAPRHPGLWLAFGHQHIGLSTGPGTALLLADLMLGETCAIDPAPFRPERFIA
jgi:D-amino-acid dehydrogenase